MSAGGRDTVAAYVGLGGNLGDVAETLRRAAEALAKLPETRLSRASRIYRNPPLGPPDQPDYRNAVVKLTTELDAEALLDALQAIETEFGRVREGDRWGPRTLDLDLLLYGETVCATERLTLPHPGLRERAFVLYPLAEIDSDLVLPGNERLTDLLAQVSGEGLECVGSLVQVNNE